MTLEISWINGIGEGIFRDLYQRMYEWNVTKIAIVFLRLKIELF